MYQIPLFFILILAMIASVKTIFLKAPKHLQKTLLLLVFSFYVLGNLYFTLLSRTPEADIRLKLPLFESYLQALGLKDGFSGFQINLFSFTQIILNVFLYIPMGFLLPLIVPQWHNRVRFVSVIGFLCSLFTEIIQLVFHLGWFETDDLINNTIGTVIGVLIAKNTSKQTYNDILK